jgi:hypothetical protein
LLLHPNNVFLVSNLSSRWVDDSPQEKKSININQRWNPSIKSTRQMRTRIDTTQRKKQKQDKKTYYPNWIHLKEDNRKLRFYVIVWPYATTYCANMVVSKKLFLRYVRTNKWTFVSLPKKCRVKALRWGLTQIRAHPRQRARQYSLRTWAQFQYCHGLRELYPV